MVRKCLKKRVQLLGVELDYATLLVMLLPFNKRHSAQPCIFSTTLTMNSKMQKQIKINKNNRRGWLCGHKQRISSKNKKIKKQ